METIIMNRSPACLLLTATLLLAACAETPMGPTVPVMPGPNTSLSQFQNDQAVCRNFAQQAVQDQAQGANLRGLGTAALTTALGAGLGAAIGGGRGAGIGAASGALGGAALAARNTSNANTSIQAQYDNAFAACMFSLGNSVPSMGR
jgi:outer membrane lipoprotein SlyB